MQKAFINNFLKHIEGLNGEAVKYVLIDFHKTGMTLVCGLKKGTPEFHKDIIDAAILEGQIPPVHYASILGGGKCKIEKNKKTIHIYDRSTVFGKPDKIILEQVLKQQIKNEGYEVYTVLIY